MNFLIHNNEAYVHPRALAECLGMGLEAGLNSIYKGLERYRDGRTTAWAYIEQGSNRWLHVNSLPVPTCQRLQHKYGADIMVAARMHVLHGLAQARIQASDVDFFVAAHYNSTQSAQLAEACGWLRLVNDLDWRTAWGGKVASLSSAASALAAQQLYGLRVSNWRVLDRKAQAWLQHQHHALLDGRRGNENAGKAPSNLRQQALARMIDLYASPQKPDILTVARVYNAEAAAAGWPQYTPERVRQLLQLPENRKQWLADRHGRNVAREITEHITRRQRPSYPDAMWSLDGTTLQLYATDGGQLVKTWYLVLVVDAATDYIVGWACGATEDTQLVLRALRIAVTSSQRAPRYIQYDGGKANLSNDVADLLANMKSIGIRAEAYNGKSKYVERVIGRLEGAYLRYMPTWVGANITARSRDSRANPDHLAAQRKAAQVSAADLITALGQAIQAYNHTPAPSKAASPAALYATEHPERRSMGYLAQVALLWVRRPTLYTYSPEGIRMEVGKARYYYEVESAPGIEDLDFRTHYLGDKFYVRYNPEDLSAINLYTKSDAWVATAARKHEYAATPAEWSEGEGAALLTSLRQRKQYLDEGQQQRRDIRAAMELIGAPELSFELVHKAALNSAAEAAELSLLLQPSSPVAVPSPAVSAQIPPSKRRSLRYDEDFTSNLINSDDHE